MDEAIEVKLVSKSFLQSVLENYQQQGRSLADVIADNQANLYRIQGAAMAINGLIEHLYPVEEPEAILEETAE